MGFMIKKFFDKKHCRQSIASVLLHGSVW